MIPGEARQQYSSVKIKGGGDTHFRAVTLIKPYPLGGGPSRPATSAVGEDGEGAANADDVAALPPLHVEEGFVERVISALSDAGERMRLFRLSVGADVLAVSCDTG